ncbi:hypothetical protein BamMEX5DRAFT_3581 [Burkholderia ambifaria MEX-5]|uniref:Uncharacterized protein n=1 Tax=Burkholderia ambifaria MEX-5 TaxID=396597 RepID=B1T704_9BURK|nr:hypothetical protein BamMEX5DRAFT_3581 [Burkholderia ambifaria MEX-5]
MPVDVDVDNDVTVLLVELRLVDSELMPVEVDVDSDVIELVALDRPVDVEVDRLLIAVFVANNCEPLIASVLVADTRPAATFVTWRSAPGAPTLTTLEGVVPA